MHLKSTGVRDVIKNIKFRKWRKRVFTFSKLFAQTGLSILDFHREFFDLMCCAACPPQEKLKEALGRVG